MKNIDMTMKRKRQTTELSSPEEPQNDSDSPVDRMDNVKEFVKKTYNMMEYCDEHCRDILYWYGGGTKIAITDVQRLSNEIFPKYFNHTKFESFARQLNFYGFKKASSTLIRRKNNEDSSTEDKEEDLILYEHRCFKKGAYDLLPKIERSTSKKNSGNDPSVDELRREIAELKQEVRETTYSLLNMKQEFEEKIAALANYTLQMQEQKKIEQSNKRSCQMNRIVGSPTPTESDSSLHHVHQNVASLDQFCDATNVGFC